MTSTESPKSALAPLPSFRNNVFVIRHGNSKANAEHIISSNPLVATKEHGLTPLGEEQALSSANCFVGGPLGAAAKEKGVVVVSSDFCRAKETAEILARRFMENGIEVHDGGVRLETRLRERFFGDLDAGADSEYNRVWTFDAQDADHTELNVESVNSVIERTTNVLSDLNKEFSDKLIFCAAHGDVLQIMQTAVERVDPRTHRSLEHLETAAIRELVLTAKE